MMQDPKMTPERWKEVDRLLNAAYDLPPHEVYQFLDSACGEDHDLRSEVEQMLAADRQAKSFIESNAMNATTHTTAEKIFSVLSGSGAEEPALFRRGLLADRYELITKLGKGGMGEVWHAYDRRLRVDIAMKSLHVGFRKNPDYVELLRREVRTAREVIS